MAKPFIVRSYLAIFSVFINGGASLQEVSKPTEHHLRPPTKPVEDQWAWDFGVDFEVHGRCLRRRMPIDDYIISYRKLVSSVAAIRQGPIASLRPYMVST